MHVKRTPSIVDVTQPRDVVLEKEREEETQPGVTSNKKIQLEALFAKHFKPWQIEWF